jgi:serine/threonine protein kinase
MSPEHKYSLPPGSRLRQYLIVRLLGHGGFGLTYLADDANLHRKVAIKELFPIDFAVRERDGTTVVARSEQEKINLQWARQRFIEEGRTLAALQHPSILHVYDIFELHGTAYLVTAFIEGSNLEDWLRTRRALRQGHLFSITNALLDALQLVHAQGFLHRDIKPENILMDEKTSRPVLIDFGNARMATGQKTASMTTVLTRGYAPLEQYQTKSRQGPFTDLYALGAVLYRAIKSAPPDDALDRIHADKVQVLSQQGIPGYAPKFLATIDKALKVKGGDRWQNCEEWKAALQGGPAGIHTPLHLQQPRDRVRFRMGLAIAGIAFLALCGGAGIGLKWISGAQNVQEPAAPSQAAPSISAIQAPAPQIPLPPTSPPPGIAPALATVEHPFVNSLGMKFVPVEITGGPTSGQRVLFSIWDTRVQDYAEYARAKGITPENPGFEQGPTYPVVQVSWEDAYAFCVWLTLQERASGKIGRQEEYRLPGDHEWSCAVRIGQQEKAKESPESKSRKIENVYPWGTQWPPPKGSGNYAQTLQVDTFQYTSPVGSFAANKSGIYDMGGNVWQWCEDWFDSDRVDRVVRGASCINSDELSLRSAYRGNLHPTERGAALGFRCVLVSGG